MNTILETNRNLLSEHPEVEDLLSPITEVILASAQQVQIPAGACLIRETERCQSFMWLLQGTVRVFKHSPAGREITLYRVTPGELCALSMQCLLWDEGFPAEVVAESDLVALTLSRREFDRAIDESGEFRRALLKILSKRMGDIVQLVSEVTFQRLDLRLACLLGQRFERSGGEPLKITHAQIARELGTTREMVSRILKEFEHQQCIRLLRGVIHLVSREGLNWFGR